MDVSRIVRILGESSVLAFMGGFCFCWIHSLWRYGTVSFMVIEGDLGVALVEAAVLLSVFVWCLKRWMSSVLTDQSA